MKQTNIVRIGKVSSVKAERGTVQVVFADMDNMVSTDLPVLFPQGLKNKAYAMPDVGENVVCIFMEQGVGDGFCLGCFYTPAQPPPIQGAEVVHYAFSDGTYIAYDRKTHKLTADIKEGEVDITAKKVNVDCDILSGACKQSTIEGEAFGIGSKMLNISCESGEILGNLTLSGDIEITGKIILSGDIVLSGNITCPGYCKC
nr:phage baseplate assembly protein V [uncultured Cellulosilyticum sp.]